MGQVQAAVERAEQTPAEVSPRQALRHLIDENIGAVGASLPTGMNPERFGRLLLTAANTNPELFECEPRSFLAAGVMAAQLGLEPNDPRGLAYLIPFRDRRRGVKVVNFIVGYKGMLDLARRSGMVSTIQAVPVFRQDRFEYRLGLDPHIEHVPGDHDENPDDLTHVYAVAKVNGDPQFVVLTRRQVDKIKAQSQGAKSNYSPWNTHYSEMAAKSAIRRLCKLLPQTVEMARADQADERSLHLGDLGVMPDPTDELDRGELHPGAIDATTGEISGDVGAGEPGGEQS